MIEWKTKNINIQNYYKIIRRAVILSAGYNFWKIFKDDWKITVIPVDQAGEYSQFYEHLLGSIEVSDGIAWGITGLKEMVLFVIDSRNPFIIRSNAMPIGHELLHAIFQSEVGTAHITRLYDAPDGKAGTRASASTVIVHDIWYGTRETLRLWISWGLGWLPITIPFITIKEAKRRYNL